MAVTVIRRTDCFHSVIFLWVWIKCLKLDLISVRKRPWIFLDIGGGTLLEVWAIRSFLAFFTPKPFCVMAPTVDVVSWWRITDWLVTTSYSGLQQTFMHLWSSNLMAQFAYYIIIIIMFNWFSKVGVYLSEYGRGVGMCCEQSLSSIF